MLTIFSLSSQSISECLAEPEVGQSEHLPLLRQLLGCVSAVTMAAGESLPQHSLLLFTVLLRIAASRHAGLSRPEVEGTVELLASRQGLGSPLDLYQAHTRDILAGLKVCSGVRTGTHCLGGWSDGPYATNPHS